MIPSGNKVFTEDLKAEIISSKNYKMDLNNQFINGYCDGLEAMRQAVYKILNTERYQYIIYSWNYGVEFADLFGEPVDFVCPEIERRITEALKQDDRVISVDSFLFDINKKHTVKVSFTVKTIFGDLNIEKEVSY